VPVSLYALALTLLAIKSVYRFSWEAAAATACTLLVLLALLGVVLGLMVWLPLQEMLQSSRVPVDGLFY